MGYYGLQFWKFQSVRVWSCSFWTCYTIPWWQESVGGRHTVEEPVHSPNGRHEAAQGRGFRHPDLQVFGLVFCRFYYLSIHCNLGLSLYPMGLWEIPKLKQGT